jgi:hypothetical protein
MPRLQTEYDEWLEKPYRDLDGEDEPVEPDPDELRDRMLERAQLEREVGDHE